MSRNPGYMPQIDGLRFFAAFGVMSFHWAGRFKLDVNLSFGPYRVPLLLVLSGFLITTILLRIKDNSENKVQAIKTFYFKRALRILPAYFLLLLLMVQLNDGYVLRYFPYFASFTSNLLSFSGKEVYTSSTTHLWNISVLEQFYLFFPWLIVFVHRKHELLLGISLVLIGMACKAYGLAADINNLNMLPFYSFDFLGGGILLAVMAHRSYSELHQLLQNKATFLMLLFLGLAYMCFFHVQGLMAAMGYHLATLLFCFFLIYKSTSGFKGALGFILECRPVVFLGRISYGLYIYHMASPFVLRRIFEKTGMKVGYGYTLYLLNILFLLIICIASWYLVEKPVANLKKIYLKNVLVLAPIRIVGRLFRA